MELNLIAIFFITFFVRIVTTVTGGGDMIIIPMLVFFGLTPSQAIANNRVGTLPVNVSILKFHQNGFVRWKIASYFLTPTVIGGLLGGLTVISIDQDVYKKIMGIVFLIRFIPRQLAAGTGRDRSDNIM